MNIELLLGIIGLAVLDSFNPATIATVALILVLVPRRPGVTAAAAITGAALAVFTVGAALFLTAGAAAGAVEGIVVVLRILAFGAGGIALIVAGIRRLQERPRSPIALPTWFRPATAVPFGIVVTAADLPNAFSYFIAIERMVAADVPPSSGLAVIGLYTLVYCLPCLILLIVGLLTRKKTHAFLDRVLTRLGTGVVRRSVPIAIILMILGVAVASVPFWIEALL
ncbi:GAP family protein [Microbacterium sp. DT81.1]|uniref:GAP family protein n=1 Tax=Microbacterium sp. DT81.1 TaxID=3393413 RepID=UPI003CEBAE8D